MSQSVCQLLWAKCIGHVLFIAVHNLFSIEWNQISDSTKRLLERALQILTIDPYAICGWKKISLENGHVLVKNRDLNFKINYWYKIPIFHYGLAHASLFCMGNKSEMSSLEATYSIPLFTIYMYTTQNPLNR